MKRGPKPVQIDPNHLRDLVAHGFRDSEIGAMYGVNFSTIYMRKKKYGIARYRPVATADRLKHLLKSSHWTLTELADLFGVSERTLESWLYERGVPPTYARIIHMAMNYLESRVKRVARQREAAKRSNKVRGRPRKMNTLDSAR